MRDAHALFSATSLEQIYKQADELEAAGMPAWAETVRRLVNNVCSGRIAMQAAIEIARLDLLVKEAA